MERKSSPPSQLRRKQNLSGTCVKCWGQRISGPGGCSRSPAATCATRSNTTCFPISRATAIPEIAARVRALCDKYDLPYTTGSFLRQIMLAERTIHKLALPDRFLVATCDDAPETASERKFLYGGRSPAAHRGNATRSGLRTALRETRDRASARRTSIIARLIHKSGRRRAEQPAITTAFALTQGRWASA